MRTMRKINKPIKFFGLSSGQFAVFMLVVALIIIFSHFQAAASGIHHRYRIRHPGTLRDAVRDPQERA